MKIIAIIFSTYLLSGLFTFGLGQEDVYKQLTDIYKKSEAYYDSDSYALSINYQSFKGHESANPSDEMTGFIKKKGDQIEVYQMGVYSIQNKQYKIIVDSTEKLIGITFPDTAVNTGFDKEKFELSKQKLEYVSHESDGRYETFTLNFKPGFQYDKINIRFFPNGMIKSLTLFLAQKIEYEDSPGNIRSDKARIVISYSNLSGAEKNVKHQMSDFVEATSQTFSLGKAYKDFELIDFRYKN